MKKLLITLPLLLNACAYDVHPVPSSYNVNVTPHPAYYTNKYYQQPNYNYQPYIKKQPRYDYHEQRDYHEHHDHGKHKGQYKHGHDD
jgi:hypothetical protein